MGVESRYGLTFGYMEHGQRNLITDVPGVRVGQVTIHDGEIHTGVTAIIPHTGDVFHEKCLAGAHVINGFGKSVGLVQVQELGTLETPILLTNTLSVGTVSTALVEYMLERNDDIGLDAGTVNSLVMECNDARLSDIRGLHVTKEHARAALAAASETFAEGDVGAGAGMVCYSLKGGIGSASRLCHLYGETYTVGALVMTNFGTLRDLRVAGDPVGERLYQQEQSELKDKGSIIMFPCPPASWSVWPSVPSPALPAPAASPATAAARSLWPSPRATSWPITAATGWNLSAWSTRRISTRCSGRPLRA